MTKIGGVWGLLPVPARPCGVHGPLRKVKTMRASETPSRPSVLGMSRPALLLILLLVLRPSLLLAGGIDISASQPAGPDPSPTKVLANGTIRITTPDGWDEIAANATDSRASYVLHGQLSALSVEILPADATIGKESLGPIVRSLRQTRQQRKEQFVDNPTAEKDARFLLRIHEKYHTVANVDDKPTDKIATQLHLYRQVGSRIMMVTVWSVADSDDELKQAQSAGEDIAMSATFTRKK
jgi:hypothetical protein